MHAKYLTFSDLGDDEECMPVMDPMPSTEGALVGVRVRRPPRIANLPPCRRGLACKRAGLKKFSCVEENEDGNPGGINIIISLKEFLYYSILHCCVH